MKGRMGGNQERKGGWELTEEKKRTREENKDEGKDGRRLVMEKTQDVTGDRGEAGR